MGWFFSIIRIAGASFPVASSLVQLQAELDSKKLSSALNELSDPISNLHEDVPSASKEIYKKIRELDTNALTFSDDFYDQYTRPLAALEANGHIKKAQGVGQQYPINIRICDASYVMYLCALYEDSNSMKKLVESVDNCKIGQLLDATDLNKTLDLPIEVIKAVFTIYESKGYGNVSKEHGKTYTGKA